MGNVDTRQVNRDSLFLLAQLRIEGSDALHAVKVRNLSAGGMMAEGNVEVARGELIHVELRNIGWVSGNVAWKQETRFGIAFIEEIDSKLVLSPPAEPRQQLGRAPSYTKATLDAPADKKSLRKL